MFLSDFRFFVPDKRETALQFSSEVGVVRNDMHRFTGFLPKPCVQFSRGGGDEASLATERHSLRGPTLDYGHRFA